MAHNPEFILAKGECFEICPYDDNHIITNLRMDVHMFKCRRDYAEKCEKEGKTIQMQPCPYGTCGEVPSIEVKFHALRCSGFVSGCTRVRFEPTHETRFLDPARLRFKTPAKFLNASIEQKPGETKTMPERKIIATVEDEYEWEKDANGYEPGYNPADKLRREGTLITPRGLSRAARKEVHRRNLQRVAELALSKPQEEIRARHEYISNRDFLDDDEMF